MISEITYSGLIHGVCERCGEESHEIDPTTGWCVDCIEEEKFYQETMKYCKTMKDYGKIY